MTRGRHRVALIGLGMAATPHVHSLCDLKPLADIAAVYCRDPQARAAFAARHGLTQAASISDILADPTIDAVGLLTPPDTHLDLVQQMAAAGKHILLEKPLETTLPRAEALAQIARDAGITLAVCLQQRFRKAARRLESHLADGRLGRILSVNTRIPLWRPQSYYDQSGRGTLSRDGGGVLITQGIHTLDLMLALAAPHTGPIAEVCGYTATAAHRMEGEDLACFAVKFSGGAVGTLLATTAAFPGGAETISFIGTRGTAELSGAGLDLRLHNGESDAYPEGALAGGAGADPMAFAHDFHREVWRDFLSCLEEGHPVRVSAAEALKVHRLIAALTEAGAGSSPVRLMG